MEDPLVWNTFVKLSHKKCINSCRMAEPSILRQGVCMFAMWSSNLRIYMHKNATITASSIAILFLCDQVVP